MILNKNGYFESSIVWTIFGLMATPWIFLCLELSILQASLRWPHKWGLILWPQISHQIRPHLWNRDLVCRHRGQSAICPGTSGTVLGFWGTWNYAHESFLPAAKQAGKSKLTSYHLYVIWAWPWMSKSMLHGAEFAEMRGINHSLPLCPKKMPPYVPE